MADIFDLHAPDTETLSSTQSSGKRDLQFGIPALARSDIAGTIDEHAAAEIDRHQILRIADKDILNRGTEMLPRSKNLRRTRAEKRPGFLRHKVAIALIDLVALRQIHGGGELIEIELRDLVFGTELEGGHSG